MMALNRRVGFFAGLKYRGGGPMWAWMLHRVSGVTILLFVGTHVLVSFFMQQTGSDFATTMNILYESWIFQIVVSFIVIFHGLNGMRIAILDIWPNFQVFQREALWLQWLVFIPVYGLTVFILVQRALTGSF
jgi:succinate dehydrogenase / fumarate reductase cytochrome b subunit